MIDLWTNVSTKILIFISITKKQPAHSILGRLYVLVSYTGQPELLVKLLSAQDTDEKVIETVDAVEDPMGCKLTPSYDWLY